ncbi:alpha-galactosidase [Olivibacter ginsenosidimutans]|uniref:Alpha-galactosidase n=2 Tax=Olivibacter ginsenosidimutans TaxID=1176537 RepID=A0ABP9AXL9_9SPHI
MLLSIISTAQIVRAQNETILFGKHNELIIDGQSGLFSIKHQQKIIIDHAYASFSTNQTLFTTGTYSSHQIKTEKINDRLLGKAIKVTLISTAAGKPTMRQLFYCYENQEFLITELEISGAALRTNYLAPLITQTAQLLTEGDVRSLFVPFDNDTFISYNAKPLSKQTNISAEIGAIYDNNSRQGLILGSLNHMTWKTGVKSAGQNASLKQLEIWAGYTDPAVTRDTMEHGYLRGNTISSPKMFVGYFSDWRDGMECYAKAGRLVEPPYIQPWMKATPVGWNSWGVIQDHLNYEKATQIVDFFDRKIPQFRNEDNTAYIDLDSYWDNMIKGGLSGDLSQLKAFVSYCQAKHLEPGVYWAPFADWGFRGNKDRIAEGSIYTFSEMWTKTAKGYHDIDGARALDPTHPGTRARIHYVINTLKDCGFKLIKIDFLGHAAAESTKFYDTTITTGMQAFRYGMEYLSDVLHHSMLTYAAISPSLATARYAHVRRIACDAFNTIDHSAYTLNSVSYGWWQTYLYDYIDADHLVFHQTNEGTHRARLISGLITGTIILGDDYTVHEDWHDQIIEWLQNPALKQVFHSGKAFRPVEGNTGTKSSTLFIRQDGENIYLAVFNFKKGPNHVVIDKHRLGLSPAETYQLSEILNHKTEILRTTLNITFEQEGAYLYRIHKK